MIKRGLVALFAILAVLAASAVPSAAADDPTEVPVVDSSDVSIQAQENDEADDATMTGYSKECSEGSNVKGCVMPYGDILWLKDKDSDWAPVGLEWHDLDSSRYGVCVDHLGVDAGWTRCNKNFTEGHELYWRLRWFEGGDLQLGVWHRTVV